MNSNKAVIFLGMSYPSGIVRYLSEVGIALYRMMRKSGMDLYFASTSKENHVGAWDAVRQVFPPDRIVTGEDFNSLVANIMLLLDKYESIVFDFGGGLNQMHYVIPYKRKYGERLKLIVTTHSFSNGTWKEFPMSFLQFLFYWRYVDKVIFQCPYAAHHFAFSGLLFKKGKGIIMPLSVLPPSLGGDSMPGVLAERGLDEVLEDTKIFKLIYLAEFREVKRHVWLTEALIPIVREHKNLHVLYCGGDSSSIATHVRAMVRESGLDKQFHIPGVIPRVAVPWMLRHCNCAVVASSSETFGQVYVEPLMLGVPIVGTRVGAGEYIIQDFTTGFGIDLKSPESLRNAVRFMVTHPDMAKTMGKNGKAIAESMFSLEGIAQSRMALYDNI